MVALALAAAAAEPTVQLTSGGTEVKMGQISFSAGPDGGKVLDVDFVQAGGAELRTLHCTGVVGGLLGPPVVGAGLGALAPALAACAPGGAATRLRWTWSGAHPGALAVEGPGDGAAQACLTAAFAKLTGAPGWTGSCSAILLSGAPAGAAAALAALP